MEFYGLSL